MRDSHDSEVDARIDDTLRRHFAPDPLALAEASDKVTTMARARLRPFALRPAAAAAALLVLALGIGVLWLVRSRPTTDAKAVAIAQRWHSTFEDAVASGFPSPGCCLPVLDLAGHCSSMFSCSLRLAPAADTELCGFYCGAFSGKPGDDPMVLLMRSEGQPVCVFVTLLQRDPRPDLGRLADQRLIVRRHELPPLVLYELTRSQNASVLPRFAVTQ